MRYQGSSEYRHNVGQRTGILLVNLGTPDAPTTSAVRRYLAEFLADPRVVEMPRWLWRMILHGIILRIRPGRVARNYQKIWSATGSPLLSISRQTTDRVRERCSQDFTGPVSVALAMRYGNPSIAATMEQLRQQNVERLLILPLYPQYSATTTASIFDAISKVLQGWRLIPGLRMITAYHDHPLYISALANSIKRAWTSQGRSQQLIFSFHGLPRRYLDAGDPYYCHCHKTARLVADQLQMASDEWQLCFQSRFGREEWLQPYTDKTLAALASHGITRVHVISPGFAADCLETLEEMAMENRKIFLDAGGKTYHYIPALNDSDEHIDLLQALVREHAGDWQNISATEALLQQRQVRAQVLGAK